MSDANHPGGGSTRPEMPRPEPDAHGQAALLLAESMLHLLVEARLLTRDQAVDAVETAGAVERERAAETHEPDQRLHESLGLLGNIERSLAQIGDR